MRSTGVTRPLDELGRIVLPKELRKTMNLNPEDRLEIFTDGNTIILRKYQPGCTFCNSMDGLTKFGGEYVCEHCRDELKKGI